MGIAFVVVVFVVIIVAAWALAGSMFFAHKGQSDLKDSKEKSEHCAYCAAVDALWASLTFWEKVLAAVHYAITKLTCLDC